MLGTFVPSYFSSPERKEKYYRRNLTRVEYVANLNQLEIVGHPHLCDFGASLEDCVRHYAIDLGFRWEALLPESVPAGVLQHPQDRQGVHPR